MRTDLLLEQVPDIELVDPIDPLQICDNYEGEIVVQSFKSDSDLSFLVQGRTTASSFAHIFLRSLF